MGTEKLKIGELAAQSGVTKRTIDYYTNLGLLQVERSASNYRYYDHSMIERIRWIEQQKQHGKCLEAIKRDLQQVEEVDIQDLRLQMLLLEQNVSKLIAQTSEQERQQLKKQVSPESVALLQSLLLLIP